MTEMRNTICRLPMAFAILLAFLFLLGGCGRLQKPGNAGDTTAIVHDGNRVTVPTSNPLSGRLQAEAADFTSVQRQVAAPASVEADPARYAKILPPLSGHVLQLFVHPGDTVKKGQALLSIDSPDFVSAQADYSRSRSALTQVERALERQKDLAAHGIVGQKDVEQATADRDAAVSDYNRAKDRLRLLGMDPDKTELGAPLIVRSPLSGKVLDVSTAPGEFRNDPNAPLMTVADLSTVWVTANVQEKDIHYVHNGDRATATFSAYPNEKFQGKVLFVADVLDPDTRTAKVRVAFNNEDGRLRPAMFATVVLKTWDTKELTVPTSALVMAGDHTTVFLEVGKNIFEQRTIQAGEQQGDRTIIKAGLQPSERVLVREGALLQ